MPEDKKHLINVNFKLSTTAGNFVDHEVWKIQFDSLVDVYFNKVKKILPSELIVEFLSLEKTLKNKLKSDLTNSQFTCTIEIQGRFFKSPVIVMRSTGQFSINFPTGWYGPHTALVRAVSSVKYEFVIKPRERTVKKKLTSLVGQELK